MAKNSWRNIDIDGNKYKWRIATAGVVIRDAETMKQLTCVPCWKVLNIPEHIYVNEEHNPPITPRHIREVIESLQL